MNSESIDEKRVDAAFDNVAKLRRSAWNLSVAETAALSERVRVEIILDKTMSRSQKRWFRAYSDFLDDVVEERIDKEGIERDSFHDWVISYLRGFLNNN